VTTIDTDRLLRLLNTAPAEWSALPLVQPAAGAALPGAGEAERRNAQAAADRDRDRQLRAVVQDLDALLERAARLRQYLDRRQLGQDHRLALRESNRLARVVRRDLGYHITHDLTV
jgi:hypothetical protein